MSILRTEEGVGLNIYVVFHNGKRLTSGRGGIWDDEFSQAIILKVRLISHIKI